ncbi:hypothetical protein [Rheinheimera sp. MMS21-TC3]|uniref:hypothetical protein n=1 Tax=Rheinheimera sp. MMS21-TC3 TaxID=3072790 RepID=UPI0028C4BCF8|nr:hypothetical protein [Rheinheimera sp. MMS21-TC3]WNO59733.1 hypothetical protein RDV63_01885 [Rheinheimera sp. MMS21-TC3]
MSGFIVLFKQFNKHYSKAILLSLLLHAILLVAILQSKFTPPSIKVKPEPIISYLYSAPVPSNKQKLQPEPTVTVPIQPKIKAEVKVEVKSVNTKPEPITAVEPQPGGIEQSQSVIAELEQRPITQNEVEPEQLNRQGLSLAQRALNRAAGSTPVDIEQAAAVGYQQYLQSQQQPKITVAKRYQALSANPGQQVIAQLNDGRQLIRTKEGCRIADPSKHDFAALMAAKTVPCGDEVSTSTQLKQALQKHIKY